MTLDTRIYVHDEVDVAALFRHCQTVLGQFDESGRGPDLQVTDHSDSSYENKLGQGLPAWLWIHHGSGAPYRTPEQAAEHDEDCNLPGYEYYDDTEPDCDGTKGYAHRPPCWAEIMLDTAYGYRGNDGMRCGDLHAALVSAIGQWLDASGSAWSWKNEFTGDIHAGADKYERLIDLVSSGFEATAWFQTTALPAILSSISKGEM